LKNTDLIAAANDAVSKGQLQRGLEYLRLHNLKFKEDAAAWHQLGSLEEQAGDWDKAGDAYYRCVCLASQNHIGYLYLGAWLSQNKQEEAAAAVFSLAQDVNHSSLNLWQTGGTSSKATKQRSKLGDTVLRRFLTNHHHASISSSMAASYIEDSVWVRTAESPVIRKDPLFAPELFFIPKIQQKPVFDLDNFSWTVNLKNNFETIKQECYSVLKANKNGLVRPYLPKTLRVDNSLQALAGSLNWSALDLYRDGLINKSVADQFPNTLATLDEIPTYGLDQTPYEAFFSILKPGQTIAPHFGQSNHSLNVHFPITVPKDCHLSVANKRYQWHEGLPLVFDDSYWHSAHNNSDQARIVLIFSIWHPDLNLNDQKLVARCFKDRKNWLNNRITLLHDAF